MAGSPEAFKGISDRDLQQIADGKILDATRKKIRDSSYAQKKIAINELEARKAGIKTPKISVKQRTVNIVQSNQEITINGIREAMGIKKGTGPDNTLRGRLSELTKAGKITRVARGVYRF